jgi:kynureninase
MNKQAKAAAALDAADDLTPCRARFHLPEGVVYLDGNSLGAMPVATPQHMADAVTRAWGQRLIASWMEDGWWQMPVTLGDRLAPVIGAGPGQTVVADGTSVSIFKAVHAALSLRPERTVIVSERASFPTDLYIVEGLIASSGRKLEMKLAADASRGLDALLGDDVAVVLLSHVDYKTGELLDMEGITRKVQAAGAIMVWDLCHSAGVVPIELDAWKVDFAMGCTYKYLNGGPGGQSFFYAAKRHHETARQPLTGWWGHAEPFAFKPGYEPAHSMRRFLTGSQAILGLKAVECGIAAMEGVSIEALRAKSLSLTGFFMDCVDEVCGGYGLSIVTPREQHKRGSQVSISFEHGFPVVQAMIEAGAVGDFRAPDIMRFGFAPLYLSHADVLQAALVMRDCLEAEVWTDPKYQVRGEVT